VPAVPRLELRRLTRRLPSGGRELTILDSVDLAIDPGERVAILGPSGSGKSTMLALMAGLDRPTAGEVLIDGAPIHALSEDELALLRRRTIGFVFQSYQLLSAVGLSERLDHFPSQLSGGEQQRVALCRALLLEPPLLLADEPTGNLDPASGELVFERLLELSRAHGTTAILVTHNPEMAGRCARILSLENGRLHALSY
jgi:putative ABC transport system ATP-binding protein